MNNKVFIMSMWICGWNAIFMHLDQETRDMIIYRDTKLKLALDRLTDLIDWNAH